MWEEEIPEETLRTRKAKETELRSKADFHVEMPISVELPTLVLPRRYEALEAEAKVRKVPLRPLVQPVQEALTAIERELELTKEMIMGR